MAPALSGARLRAPLHAAPNRATTPSASEIAAFQPAKDRPHAADGKRQLAVVQERLHKQGRLGPVARLLPTTAATTLRKQDPPLIVDGPFAETKEQLLGFYLIDCKNLDEALQTAQELGDANPGGSYEIRPVGVFNAGGAVA